MRCVNELIQIQDTRLLQMERNFESSLRELTADFESERDHIVTQHKECTQQLDDFIKSLHEHELTLTEHVRCVPCTLNNDYHLISMNLRHSVRSRR